MKLVLHVWRQKSPGGDGKMVRYDANNVNPDMSFLEMLDVLNERLIAKGEEPIAFESDCREGICGACGLVINGMPHGHRRSTTTCQLHMRVFHDGEARRDDERFCHVAAWEYQGDGKKPVRHVEPLDFEYVHLATRSYK